MARESQGLQVLLIIFVMLTVVLGVTTYLYKKDAFEKTNAAVAADGRAQQSKTEKDAVIEENKTLKTWIGMADQPLDAIKTKFDGDQQKAGVTSSADADQKQANVMGYTQMVDALSKTVEDRTVNLKLTKDQVASQQDIFKTREAAKDNAIAKIDAGFGAVNSSIKQVSEDNQATLAKLQVQMDADHGTMIKSKSMAAAEVQAADAKAKVAQEAARKAEADAQALNKTLRGLDKPQMDVPTGDITWVSLPNKTVWINRGRADSLQRQTRFTVYSGDSNDAATAIKKGTIEVTRIVADHQAECRIVDDKLTDPMMANDKIFSALWSPGQKNHFALSGIMNLDGDGRNQVNAVVELIKSSGGEVDCWLDEQGHRQGQINSGTQYVVLGDPPDKGSQEMVKNNGDILRDKERYEVHSMSLAEFKQRVNYQKSSSVEHFGSGASTADLDRAATAAKAAHAAKAATATKAEDKDDAFAK